MDAKIIKLQEIEKRYNDINEELMKEDVVSDVKKYTKLSKEQAKIKASYDAYQNYKKYTSIIEDGEEMLKDPDPEIKEMAETVLSRYVAQREEMKETSLPATCSACIPTMPILWDIKSKSWSLRKVKQAATP